MKEGNREPVIERETENKSEKLFSEVQEACQDLKFMWQKDW